MFGWSIDPTYFWYVFIPTVLISLGVQIYPRSTFSKWSGARSMLTAAGLTYLAAAITSILQLLYYISVAQRRG